jgi:hypothetical protein
MGPDSTRGEGAFVGQLADHARQLQREAREAIARGDYARASALIGDAELLADDVHGIVDDFEHREANRMMGLAAAEAEATRSRLRKSRPCRLRLAIGASLAISLALVEC